MPADLPEGELQDWGPVKYTMVWGGKTTSYESAGRLYAAGKNTTPAVLANTENVSLLTDYTDDSTFIATYHRGAKIPMVGCFQYNGTIFYEVAGATSAATGPRWPRPRRRRRRSVRFLR